jgi:O-antigen ligase
MLFTEYAVASLFWSSISPFNVDKLLRFVVLTSSSFFVACVIGSDAKRRARLVRMIALVSVGVVLYYAYNRFVLDNNIGGLDSALDFPEGTPDYNGYAEHAELLFIICLSVAVLGLPVQAYVGFAGMCLTLVGLVLIGGRGQFAVALLSIPTAGAVLLSARARGRQPVRRLVLLIAALGALGGVGYAAVLQNPAPTSREFRTFERIDAQLSGEDTSSLDMRAQARAMAFTQWLRKPLIGWGIGEFEVQDREARYPHNMLLEILMELGMVGAGLFLSVVTAGLLSCALTALDGPPDWPLLALMLIFLMDLALRMTVQGYLANDRMFFSYMGVMIGSGWGLQQTRRHLRQMAVANANRGGRTLEAL